MQNVISNTQFKLNTEKTGLQQTARNNLKQDIMTDLLDKLANLYGADGADIRVGRVAEGIAVSIYNEPSNQDITFVVDLKIKGFDFDYDLETQDYVDGLAEKEQKALAKAKAKAQKIARDTAERNRKKLEKSIQNQVATGKLKMSELNGLLEE